MLTKIYTNIHLFKRPEANASSTREKLNPVVKARPEGDEIIQKLTCFKQGKRHINARSPKENAPFLS